MYKTVFTISSGFNTEFFLFCGFGGFLLLFGLIEYNRHRRGKKSLIDRSHGITPSVFLCIAALVVFTFNIEYLTFRHELVSVYNNARYLVIEGKVEVLHEQPEHGHDRGDIILIEGEEFEVNYFESTIAYTQTIAHGGILKDGVYAKVYHYDGKILRIDIRE